MAVSVTQLKTYLQSAVTAMGAADWSGAETAIMQAWATLAGLPDAIKADAEAKYRDEIDRLHKAIRQRRHEAAIAASSTTSGGCIQFSKLKYIEETD